VILYAQITGVLQCVASVLQWVVVGCGRLQLVAGLVLIPCKRITGGIPHGALCCSVLRCVAVRCSVLLCIVVRCIAFQCKPRHT